MKTSLLAISLLLVSHTLPVWASEAPASELSVREMLHITQTEQNYRDTMVQAQAQVLHLLEQQMASMPVAVNSERMRAFQAKLVTVMMDESGWSKMEPEYVRLYQDTFNQTEIDGMLAFYRSEAGQAVVAKTPILTRKSMELVMAEQMRLLPRVEALITAFLKEARAAASPKSGKAHH
ncbi:MAG: DUF2059 domain-containing protein [Rivihabitans pingtungensis]|jgi:hypothetical protein|uniref:DUF2059 domain-containing protein n=1 Tax=Rivihabitans pingtungensis TaxID=1054498 RepID=UPI0023F21103|nr:DUF2059 domain-containing protein [Rivihabitans pingtungensis]HNX71111.1 DUF2059 domain-containing protein [Rivihabitans pingtungensis]